MLGGKDNRMASVTGTCRLLVRVLLDREWIWGRYTYSMVVLAEPTSGAWDIQGKGQGHSREGAGTFTGMEDVGGGQKHSRDGSACAMVPRNQFTLTKVCSLDQYGRVWVGMGIRGAAWFYIA